MKASELRLGNLVKIGGEINQLELCDFVDIHEHKTIWQYEPIPITEEWLLKFGFEKGVDDLVLDINTMLFEFRIMIYKDL